MLRDPSYPPTAKHGILNLTETVPVSGTPMPEQDMSFSYSFSSMWQRTCIHQSIAGHNTIMHHREPA